MEHHLREAFEFLIPNENGIVDIAEAVNSFESGGYDISHKMTYGILCDLLRYQKNINFDIFKSFVSKYFDYLPSTLSTNVHEDVTDLNLINKYLFLCDIYAEGELLSTNHLQQMKQDMLDEFNLDKIDQLIVCSEGQKNGILKYEDFKRILS